MNSDDGSADEPSGGGALLETQSCPNCGRSFVGDYCPDCGQAVSRELSVLDVFSGLLREIIDIERGLWATLRALTLRPGAALGRYLNGARRGFMHPGRYLLASVVTSYAVSWGLRYMGSMRPLGEEAAQTGPVSAQTAFQRIFQHQETQIVSTFILAGLLALTLGRLFSHRIRRGAHALALGSFLTGHTTFLTAGAVLVVVVSTYGVTGQPVESPRYLYPILALPYIWAAAFSLLGRGIWVGLKVTLALVWTAFEYMVVSTAVFCGWALWVIWAAPLGAPSVGIPVDGLVVTGGGALGLLLLHAAGETYACL